MRCRRTTVFAVSVALFPAFLPVAAGADPANARAEGARVVNQWNATTADALVTDAALPSVLVFIGSAYVQAAVYNAVVGINGHYQPYRWEPRGPRDASTGAAVAAAAHRVLLTYFPVSQPRVDAAYTATLAGIPDGAAKNRGVRFGERAAAHLIAQRAGDGWLAPVSFDTPLGPGVWRPTPPTYTPFTTAFVGKMRPFLLARHDQFRPSGPPAMTSARYAADFNEVKSLGSATSSTRTAEQTRTALFFTDNLAAQVQAALRDHIARHHLNVVEAARYFAAADLAGADSYITAWDAKLHFGFWRPITAIQLAGTDGNPATTADPGWSPLVANPPFPDYLSGHATGIGAVTAALTRLTGTHRIDLRLSSLVTGTTRTYMWANKLNTDIVSARIWAGIHFRTADEVGNSVGNRVGGWAVTHYFGAAR